MALAAIKGDRTLAELSEYFDVHPNQITQWKNQLLERAEEAFEGAGSKEPSIDVKTLHAKIGELTLENDFLEGEMPPFFGHLAVRFSSFHVIQNTPFPA